MKKAQAAMEFLMTYGWAILVVLLVIASLAYFGVLNPARFLPETFLMGPELQAMDFTIGVTNSYLITTVFIQNNLADIIDITSIRYDIIGCDPQGVNLITCPPLVQPGGVTRIDMRCPLEDHIVEGMRFKSDVTVTYDQLGGFSGRSKKGTVSGYLELTEDFAFGDFYPDHKIDLTDLTILGTYYGNTPEDNDWDPSHDLDCDGVVGQSDLDILSSSYGESW